VIAYALILSFVTWRVTSLLYIEEPFAWLRRMLGVSDDAETGARIVPANIGGALFDCFWCLSLVVAFVFAAATWALSDLTLYEAFLAWLASAAGALVLDVRYFARLRG
jgi:hypothetical protein